MLDLPSFTAWRVSFCAWVRIEDFGPPNPNGRDSRPQGASSSTGGSSSAPNTTTTTTNTPGGEDAGFLHVPAQAPAHDPVTLFRFMQPLKLGKDGKPEVGELAEPRRGVELVVEDRRLVCVARVVAVCVVRVYGF